MKQDDEWLSQLSKWLEEKEKREKEEVFLEPVCVNAQKDLWVCD